MNIEGLKDTIEWYDRNAEKYATATSTFGFTDKIDRFVSLVSKNGRILDVGCGSGRDSAVFKQKKYKVTGLDLSKGLINEAKKRHPGIRFIHGNMLALPFQNNSFDAVWANASLLHLETVHDVKTALGEFRRVLKNDGALQILVKAQTGSKKTAIVSDTLSQHDRFFQYFTQEEIRELLTKGGFNLIEIEQYKEIDQNPHGRPEVEWIRALAKRG